MPLIIEHRESIIGDGSSIAHSAQKNEGPRVYKSPGSFVCVKIYLAMKNI